MQFSKSLLANMSFFRKSVYKLMDIRYRKLEDFRKHPIEYQQEIFKDLIKKAVKTEWGILHDYKSIASTADYSRIVPLNDYDTVKSWVERMVAGEKNILWPGEVKWFAKSSGTTSDKSKFIPVSDESLKKTHFKASMDIFAMYVHNFPDSDLLVGKNLSIGGSHRVSNISSNTQTGDLSALMLHNLPPITRFMNSPKSEIALIPDFEEKIEKIVKSTLNEKIVSFTGVPSWFLVLIKKVLEESGKDNLLEVWPHLEVFVHGGVNFEPYREQYKKLIPSDKMRYINSYNASEGFFAVQDDLSSDDMLLMLDHGIYYEFIPMSEFHNEDRKAIPLEDVEVGVNYAIVISTTGGLWRYIIGDTVKFTSKFPFKIKITGRTRHFINAFGEEIIIDNAVKGLDFACEKTGAIINEYTAGPVFMDTTHKGAHQWIIEFEKEPDNLDEFADFLDAQLQALNSDYEAKRFKNITLNRLELISAPKGAFYQWMKKRGKVGGQNKIPRLANDRLYLDPMLEIINEISKS